MRNVFAVVGTLASVFALVLGAFANLHGGAGGPFVLLSTPVVIFAIWKTRESDPPEKFWAWVVFGPLLIVVIGLVGSRLG